MGAPRLAALSSGLLARKGQARPAMRPQGTPAAADDLGWNDMGDVPPVLVERAALAADIQATRRVSVATATRMARETAKATAKGKAAFTLRLDHDRHIRLRLASAVTHLSAQALVTAALDDFLKSLPEVETLVAQLPAPAQR